MKNKKKKSSWKQYIGMAFMMLMGAGCGLVLGGYLIRADEAGVGIGEKFFTIAVLFLAIYVAIFAHLIIHEAGHLVFGLLTGYKFCSFRIGNVMWVKKEGKIQRKKLSLAGTGGQCLMDPPKYNDGNFPVALYNFGGAIFNMVTGLLCVGLYFIFQEIELLSATMMIIAIVGFALALMNGIPLRMGLVDNDGYNAVSLGKNPKALRSFWIQMKMSKNLANGIRLKDLPMEWFSMPTQEERQNSLVAALAVFACNRMMDEQRFEQAYKQMQELLAEENGVVGLHKSMMICDCIYCEAVGECRVEEVERMLDKEQLNFMKSMKQYPSILRTWYVYYLLVKKNIDKAKEMKESFLKRAETYPYSGEIESELELMNIADEILAGGIKPEGTLVWYE